MDHHYCRRWVEEFVQNTIRANSSQVFIGKTNIEKDPDMQTHEQKELAK
jgi:hypothetical protein